MSDISGAYVIEAAPADLAQFTIKPRGALRSTMHSWEEYLFVKDTLFEEFGLSEYIGCLMGEAKKRQIVNVFPRSKTDAALSIFDKYAPTLYERLFREYVVHLQPLDRKSRLGYPWFKRYYDKRSVVQPEMDRVVELGPSEAVGTGWVAQGVRLQPEQLSKVRKAIFLTPEGRPYADEITKEARFLPATEHRPEGYAARYRPVWNFPGPVNLLTQVHDTNMHAAQLKHRGYKHRPTVPGGVRQPWGKVVGIDVRNFDFFMGPIWRRRAQIFGGLYQQCIEYEASLPFLSMADDGHTLFFVWVNGNEWTVQFGSGASAVAPQQKDLFMCINYHFATELLGKSPSDAWHWALEGGDDRMGFLNYGDDNLVFGDDKVVDDYLAFLATILDIEVEDPTKFLGFLVRPDGFKLAKSSYLLKTWLNERAPFPPFRAYPHHGWVEKRATYTKYGEPGMLDVFRREDELLAQTSLSWHDIEQRAVDELAVMQQIFLAQGARDLLTLEKDYQLSPEERAALPGFQGIPIADCERYVKALIPDRWLSLIP